MRLRAAADLQSSFRYTFVRDHLFTRNLKSREKIAASRRKIFDESLPRALGVGETKFLPLPSTPSIEKRDATGALFATREGRARSLRPVKRLEGSDDYIIKLIWFLPTAGARRNANTTAAECPRRARARILMRYNGAVTLIRRNRSRTGRLTLELSPFAELPGSYSWIVNEATAAPGKSRDLSLSLSAPR